jgi:hypothetical protein
MTTIPSNHSTHQCCPTKDAQQQSQSTEQKQASTAPANNWQAADTGDAATNNRFAGQLLAQQTNGPMTTTTTANQYGGMTLSKTVDMDGNGQNEASLTSAFDESGNLRANSYTADNSGDGVADYGEAYTYDRQGNVTGHLVVEDTDLNGTMDKQSHTQDKDGNGLLDTKTTVNYDDNGNLTSRSVAQDVNEDGIMDFAFNETFDEQGNRTSYGTTIFEDGIYGSNNAGSAGGNCGCDDVQMPVQPGPEEPVVITSPPSGGGTSTPELSDAEALSGLASDFATFDTDGSGFLSKQELQAVVDGGGPLAGTAQKLLDNYNGAIFGNIDPTNEAWAGMSLNDVQTLQSAVAGGKDMETAIWDAAILIGAQRGVVPEGTSREDAITAMNNYVETTQDRLGVQDDVAPPSAGGTSSPEQPEPRPVITGEVEIFEHSNYNGKKSTLGLGYYSYNDIKAMGLNDKTSSLKVPEGMVVVAYEHADKRGEQFVYKSDTNWVGGGANDKFSSFEVMTEQEYAARQSKTVDLFEHANYKGDVASFTLEGDYQFINYDQINAMGMNDKTSSLKVPEGMVVVAYEHANRGGNKSVYTADSGWVGSGVNDKFSSLELMTQAEYDKRYGSSVEVFEHASYAGQSATLSAGFYDIQALKNLGLHDKISSIKVPEDMVLVTWEHGNKGGTRNVYREGDTAFVGGGNNDNISNMEVMTEAEYLERINNGGF